MKHIHLERARERAHLTQQQLEDASGVDRTRISKLEVAGDARVLQDTYDKLDAALRAAGGLRRGEKLVFGPAEAVAS